MTLYLENTSEKKTITLRYGEGNNYMLQINPKKKELLPLELTKQKLKIYLHLFKDLKLVEEKEKKVESNENISKNNIKPENPTNSNKEGEQSGSDSTEKESTESDSEPGENTEGQGDKEPENNGEDSTNENESLGENDGQDNKEDESSESSNEGQSSSESTSDAENGVGESRQRDKLPQYTEKELTKFSAEQVKEIAKQLGIEVTEDSTKKALIPVILNKQGN